MSITKTTPFAFDRRTHPNGLRVPKGTRVFSIGDEIVRIPGKSGEEGSTVIFVHPDDIQKLKEANP